MSGFPDGEAEPNRRVDRLARGVIGAALDVHASLGPGFLESIYEEALAVELTRRAVPFERQFPFDVKYKGYCVGRGRLDFLVAGELIVELKAVEVLLPIHTAQVISYLRAINRSLALLLTFDVRRLRDGIRRVIVR